VVNHSYGRRQEAEGRRFVIGMELVQSFDLSQKIKARFYRESKPDESQFKFSRIMNLTKLTVQSVGARHLANKTDNRFKIFRANATPSNNSGFLGG
jgi:hypothetical protein